MELEWEKKSYVVFYPGNKESIKTVGKYFISPLLALGSQSLHQPETNTGFFEKIVLNFVSKFIDLHFFRVSY